MLGRLLAIHLMVAASVVGAPASQPTVDSLLAGAVEQMRAGKLDKAGALLEKACTMTPAAQRTRPLVLNRAIVDTAQKTNVMRALRELTDYLVNHPAIDEPATNILGTAMDVAATTNPRAVRQPVWQAALHEWDRRNAELDRARPGMRRWGTRWVSDEQYKMTQEKRESLRRDIEQQAERVSRAASAVGVYSSVPGPHAPQQNQWVGDLTRDQINNPGNSGLQGIWGQDLWGVTQPQPPFTAARQRVLDAVAQQQLAQAAQADQFAEQLRNARLDLELEKQKMNELLRIQAGTRPEWPKKLDPVDPQAAQPPPLEVAAATTAPANDAAPTTAPATVTPPPPPPPARPSPDDLYGPSPAVRP